MGSDLSASLNWFRGDGLSGGGFLKEGGGLVLGPVDFPKAGGLPALGEGRVLSQRAGFARWLKVRAHHASFVVTIPNHCGATPSFRWSTSSPENDCIKISETCFSVFIDIAPNSYMMGVTFQTRW